MIDERKIIKRLQTRIDEYVGKYPEKANSLEVETINEFIEMLKQESAECEKNQ